MVHEFRHPRFRVFISSTGDLRAERDAVENALSELEINAERFEAWPATPNAPVDECLLKVRGSDVFILLLGFKYGSISPEGISATHSEYRKAQEIRLPILAFILDYMKPEDAQQRFIEEVRKDTFAPRVESRDRLSKLVKRSVIGELVRSFRTVREPPRNLPPSLQTVVQHKEFQLPDDPDEALAVLARLDKEHDYQAICKLASMCEQRFERFPRIMNLVYASLVNLAMRGEEIEGDRLIRAVEFWGSETAKQLWPNYMLNYNAGNALTALERHDEAIEKFHQALADKPSYAKCWKNLGSEYVLLGDTEEGRKCYEKALTIDPFLYEGLYCMGTLKIQHEEDFGGALTYLNRISNARLGPHQLASVQGWKALAYAKTGQFLEAIASTEDSLKNAPDMDWAWSVAARIYVLARHENKSCLAAAARFWKGFLRKYPENAQGWAEFGFVCWFLNLHQHLTECSDLSLNAYLKAIELGFEDDGLVWDRIAHLQQERGNFLEAERAFRQAVSKNPKEFGYCLGNLLISLERYEEALPWMKLSAEVYDRDGLGWSQFALCLVNLQRIAEAVEAYKTAICVDPNYPDAWFELGGLYWNAGEHIKAKTAWLEAIKKFPDFPRAPEAKMRLEFNRLVLGL